MNWLFLSVTFPLWQVIVLWLYIAAAQIYITYRLAKEIDGIINKLRKFTIFIASMLPRPIKIQQNQRIHDKSKYAHDNLNYLLRNIENVENSPEKQCSQERADKPSPEPFHIDKSNMEEKACQPKENLTSGFLALLQLLSFCCSSFPTLTKYHL